MRYFASSKTAYGLKIFCQNSLSFFSLYSIQKTDFIVTNNEKSWECHSILFLCKVQRKEVIIFMNEMNRFTCRTENNPPLQTPVSIKRSLSQNESEIRNLCTQFAVCTTCLHSKFLENRPTLSDMDSNKHRQTKNQAVNVKTRPRLTIFQRFSFESKENV